MTTDTRTARLAAIDLPDFGMPAGSPELPPSIYAARLERATAAAQAGDGRFIASPRVDSYHSAWFELHEDLILHAGRTRADEVKAGRA